MCFKVITDGDVGHKTYDFLLVFYSVTLAVFFTVCALQSILCQNDLAGRLCPLNDCECQTGSSPK